MRRFSSYGPVNHKLHYYAPREELIKKAYTSLLGEIPDEGGYYITVWAPRQCGKTWLMQQILFQLQKNDRFDVLKINLENHKDKTSTPEIIAGVTRSIGRGLGRELPEADNQEKFQELFKKGVLNKPLVLILDEFDALAEQAINSIVSAFRNIYLSRMDEVGKSTGEKNYLLHSVALVGVRSVLGVEDMTGSPFNIQKSLHVPNLSFDEVTKIYQWYERESGQKVGEAVIQRLFYETRGQPGLTCWLGELLTEGCEGYQPDTNRPIDMNDFEKIFAAATYDLPNANIMNIISKARQEPYQRHVLELFRTDSKMDFSFDSPYTNFLYMHGVIDKEIIGTTQRYVRFANPFIQKRLFNYFSRELYRNVGQLYSPQADLDRVTAAGKLDIRAMIVLYQQYLQKNNTWLFKEAPRRSDMRVREAVFHFNLYAYLNEFLKSIGGIVYPEFPTGNGKVDLLIDYKGNRSVLELKSFTNLHLYREALPRAAQYARSLGLPEIHVIFFVEALDEENIKKYEEPVSYPEQGQQINVIPIFVQTGTP